MKMKKSLQSHPFIYCHKNTPSQLLFLY